MVQSAHLTYYTCFLSLLLYFCLSLSHTHTSTHTHNPQIWPLSLHDYQLLTSFPCISFLFSFPSLLPQLVPNHNSPTFPLSPKPTQYLPSNSISLPPTPGYSCKSRPLHHILCLSFPIATTAHILLPSASSIHSPEPLPMLLHYPQSLCWQGDTSYIYSTSCDHKRTFFLNALSFQPHKIN